MAWECARGEKPWIEVSLAIMKAWHDLETERLRLRVHRYMGWLVALRCAIIHQSQGRQSRCESWRKKKVLGHCLKWQIDVFATRPFDPSEKVYGQLGTEYIEVHHLRPVADAGGSHLINPKTDLKPVCSNCHRMLHRRRPALSIDELIACMNDA